MSTEMESKVNETIKNLENLETSQVQEAQQKILEELYAIREGLSKCRPTGEATLKELYSLRTTLMGEIQESRKMQNMLMRRTERVGHLKRNFKKMFDVCVYSLGLILFLSFRKMLS